MTHPRPAAIPLSDARRAARRPAVGLSPAVGAALGALLALFLVAVFVVLDYRFGQAPHRLIKVLLGAGLIAGILVQPRVGLFVIPVITPFLPWIPPLPVPGVNPLNVLLGSVFLTWGLHRLLRRGSVFRDGRLGWIMGILVALAALSVVRGAAFPTGYTFDAPSAALQLFRSAVPFSVYFIVLAMARGERDRRWLAYSVVLGLLAEASCTMLLGRSGRGSRAVGSIGQSNELGAFLALYTVLAAALLPAARGLLARLFLIGSTAAGCYGVILSISRGSLLAMVLGLLYVSLKSSRAMTVLLAALLLLGPWWAPDYLKERLMGTQVEVEGTDKATLEGSAQLRIDTWKAIIKLVTSHPLDGVGFSGLAYVLPETGDALGIEVKDSSHNTFLRFLSEMGILGLAAFLVLLWQCWRLARDGMRAARGAFDRQLSIGLAASTLTMVVSCAFGDRFFNILITGSFWTTCALVNDLLLERREAAA